MNFDISTIIARFVVLITAIPVHEAAHAFISNKLGDPTAKNCGRLTLNPLAHFDIMGSLCLLLTGIGWAKPVPIDVRYFQNRKSGMAISALAGPVSNLILAYISMILYKTLAYFAIINSLTWLDPICSVLSFMVVINVSLGIFNLLPVPPFDGSRIFGALLPDKIYFGIMKYEQYIFIVIFALLMFGVLD
ncbi:MAG: site-2 protease family protein, partial [Oscillospiraceae bacterium]